MSATAGRLTVRTDAGENIAVTLSPETTYVRTQPGATNLTGATPITLSDIGLGDRVWARGTLSADRATIPARQVVVMAKADIARKQELERAEWRRRGIAGVVTAVNPETKEITVRVSGREGQVPVVLEAGRENISFRRYAPDSVRYDAAQPSSLAQIQVGDQLRALGERSADGARYTPEQIVFGTFRQAVGNVTAVNAVANEVQITLMGQQQPLTITINSESMVRRIPPQMAGMLAGMPPQGGGQPPAGAPQGGQPGGQGQVVVRRAPEGGQAGAQPQQRPAPGQQGPGAAGPGGGPPRGDVTEMIRMLPALPLTDLKPGDMVLVATTAGANPQRATAIAVVAGVEPLMAAMMRGAAGRPGAGGGPNTGLPINLDLGGIGGP